MQYDLLQRLIILSPSNLTLQSKGVRFPWGEEPVVLVSFEFFMKIWFYQFFKAVSKYCHIGRDCVHLTVLKVLTGKVFIDTIIIKFENTKLGIVQYKDD